MVFEDFHPLDDEYGLVACGESYVGLDTILRVRYELSGGRVEFSEDCDTMRPDGIMYKGTPTVRLGNICHEVFTFSSNRMMYVNEMPIGIGHQPFLWEHGLLYQHNLTIELNGKVLIARWDNMESVGRPTAYGNTVLFECREKPAPQGWEVWKYDMNTQRKERVLEHGANPYYHDGKLFYSSWEGDTFVNRYKEIEL